MNLLVFVLLAAVPTAWLLWRRGWIDKRRRFGLVLAIVTAVYFVIFRALPDRAKPVAPPAPAQARRGPWIGHEAMQFVGEGYPRSEDYTIAIRLSRQRGH